MAKNTTATVESTDKAPALLPHKTGKGNKAKGTDKTTKATAEKGKKTKKANEYKNYKAADGTNRGIVRPAGWIPPEEARQSSAAELKEKNGTPLRKPQARILALLAKSKGPQPRSTISELTGIDQSWVGDWIGYREKEKRDEQERKWGRTSLITLGCAKWVEVELEGRTVWCAEITAAGRKALEQYNKIMVEKEKPTADQDLKEYVKKAKK